MYSGKAWQDVQAISFLTSCLGWLSDQEICDQAWLQSSIDSKTGYNCGRGHSHTRCRYHQIVCLLCIYYFARNVFQLFSFEYHDVVLYKQRIEFHSYCYFGLRPVENPSTSMICWILLCMCISACQIHHAKYHYGKGMYVLLCCIDVPPMFCTALWACLHQSDFPIKVSLYLS